MGLGLLYHIIHAVVGRRDAETARNPENTLAEDDDDDPIRGYQDLSLQEFSREE